MRQHLPCFYLPCFYRVFKRYSYFLQRAGVKFFQSDEEEEEDGEESEAVTKVPPVEKADKECWTHAPEFDKYVLFYRNNMNNAF